MKNIYTFPALLIAVLFNSCTIQNYPQSQNYVSESPDISYQQFYDGLSPYGNWVDYQNYGYVWVPNEQGFRPYYNNGHWVYTNYGWTWVSNYNWGWAPFHYGRWLYDDDYGWMWVPGYEWAPAWVSWRSSNDYYGWAPLGPGNNFDMSVGSGIPYRYWAFVPNRYINSPRINNYYIDREKNVTIINNTTVINNTNVTVNKTVYVTGPSAIEVEKVTNEKIRPVKIIQKNTPGNTEVSGSAVTIYKPGVKETPKQNEQVKPSKIVHLNDLKVRRENAGPVQNEVPGKPVVPVDTKPKPVLNPEKNNKTPTVKDNPVKEKQVEIKQPQKTIPGQQVPDLKGDNNPQTQNPQQNNNIKKQPEVIDNQSPKVKIVNQPNKNPSNIPQNNSPVPVDKEPVKTKPVKTVIPQRVPSSSPGNRQVTNPPVNHAPLIRPQNPRVTRGGPQRDSSKRR